MKPADKMTVAECFFLLHIGFNVEEEGWSSYL